VATPAITNASGRPPPPAAAPVPDVPSVSSWPRSVVSRTCRYIRSEKACRGRATKLRCRVLEAAHRCCQTGPATSDGDQPSVLSAQSCSSAVFGHGDVPDPCHNEMRTSEIGQNRSRRTSTLIWHDAESFLLRGHFGTFPKLNTGVRFPSSAPDEVPALSSGRWQALGRLVDITPAKVRSWRAGLIDAGHPGASTVSKSYRAAPRHLRHGARGQPHHPQPVGDQGRLGRAPCRTTGGDGRRGVRDRRRHRPRCRAMVLLATFRALRVASSGPYARSTSTSSTAPCRSSSGANSSSTVDVGGRDPVRRHLRSDQAV
jgi:hypothetical protein